MVSNQAIDDLALEIERTIDENRDWLDEEMPDFPPRAGKFEVGNGAVIPVEDMMKQL